MSSITTPAQLFDDGMAPVIGLDPATGKRYLRANGYVFAGQGRWMEWYAPNGETILRLEFHPLHGARIVKGSFAALRAINPAFVGETENQVMMNLTDYPFDCMEGVPAGAMESALAMVHESNKPILAGA